MTSLLEVGLANAVLATGLALVVWLATRVWRHPVFVHTLWIVVLVKLITPPLVSVPWGIVERSMPSQEPSTSRADSAAMSKELTRPEESAPIVFAEPDDIFLVTATETDAVPTRAEEYRPPAAEFPLTWTTAAISIWLAGTVIYMFVSAARLVQFHRALAHVAAAPDELQQIAGDLARRFGITNRYRLRVTDGHLAPLVWPIGRPTIVMPRRLVAELSTDELATLLAHEFAHLSRRDHWVRWLELAVTAIYWWHPVVWWAKAAIGRAEEKVCDAWVVAQFAGASAPYASALFKAVQFASARRQAAPVMASALGGRDLKERIEHIMNATWKPRLLLPVRLCIVSVAILVLPLSLQATDGGKEAPAPMDQSSDSLEDATDAAGEIPAGETLAETETNSDATAPAAADSSERDFATTENQENQLIISSPDANTLDRAEELLSRGLQPRRVPVPAHPYHIAPGDVLAVSVIARGVISPPVISGDFVVEPSGSIALGPMYGRANVAGLPLEEAEKAIITHLQKQLRDPKVQITIGGWRNAGNLNHYVERARQEPKVRASTPATSYRRTSYPEINVSTPAPAVGESIGVLKKIVDRAQQDYNRLLELSRQNVVGAAEVARAKSEYEISVERLKQGERALRYYRAQVAVAEADYAAFEEARMRAPDAVSNADLRRAKLAVELARAKLEELSE
jgi:beta-lactamase regulating signal transducer with metallopeptidase domain